MSPQSQIILYASPISCGEHCHRTRRMDEYVEESGYAAKARSFYDEGLRAPGAEPGPKTWELDLRTWR